MISLRHGLTHQISERFVLTQDTGHSEIRKRILCIASEEHQLLYDGALPRTRRKVLAHLTFYKVYIGLYST